MLEILVFSLKTSLRPRTYKKVFKEKNNITNIYFASY